MRKNLSSLLLILLSCFLIGCGKVIKPDTPEAKHAMRTRSTELCIDSVWSKETLNTSCSVFDEISLGKLFDDVKNVTPDTTSESSEFRQKIDGIKSIGTNHSDGYNPGLTTYFLVVLSLFIIIVVIKSIRAFIIKR